MPSRQASTGSQEAVNRLPGTGRLLGCSDVVRGWYWVLGVDVVGWRRSGCAWAGSPIHRPTISYGYLSWHVPIWKVLCNWAGKPGAGGYLVPRYPMHRF